MGRGVGEGRWVIRWTRDLGTETRGRGDVRWWGELAYFGAGICWSAFTVMLRGFRVAPLEGAALASTFSLPYLVVYVLWLNPQMPSSITPKCTAQVKPVRCHFVNGPKGLKGIL